jgi:hypothetical protein
VNRQVLVLLGLVACGMVADSSTASAEPPVAFPTQASNHPIGVSCLAKPAQTPHYVGGYVGGGSLFRGTPRASDEGIFGWDYLGVRRLPHRIFLGWSHGRKQPAGGQYKTDGPEVLDVFTLRPVRRVHKHGASDE